MTLADTLTADVTDVFLTDFAEAVTIDGTPAQAIVYDDFESADPRSPQLRVATAVLDGVVQGDEVVLRGVTYTIEFVRPGRHGTSFIGLTAL